MRKHKNINALFQIDTLSQLSPETDSSLDIIKEGLKLGLNIWITNPDYLTFYAGRISFVASKVKDSSLKLYKSKKIYLEKFDFFFIRQDPPFDMKYISNCYLLELHKKFNKKPLFINDPTGIKNFTEKIFPLYFHNLMPKTMVSSSVKDLMYMFKKHNTLVFKPLYCKGGKDIYKFSRKDKDYLRIFQMLISKYKSPVVIQKFIEKVKYGDKRVILVNGKTVGAVNRIPKSGAFKANLHLGGTARKTRLSKKEIYICNLLGGVLRENKLFFVGIDLIDQKLTEINVTSPTGIVQLRELYNVNVSKLIWEELISIV